jgi:glucose/arabinose dehydrogenase
MTPLCPRLLSCSLVVAVQLACARSAPAKPPDPPLARSAAPWVQVSLAPALTGFRLPVQVTNARDGSKRLFVVEQGGLVRVVQGGVIEGAPFLDITKLLGAAGGEQGLLGLAFHPKSKDNGRVFFAYTDAAKNNAFAEVRIGKDGRADMTTLRVLFAIDDFAGNHNGGMLAFGPDGKLWIGTGDGGGGGDPQRTAQNDGSLLGKMLVLDVDAGPATGKVTPTIAFLGLRNPWRFSFDRLTGDLWIGDVGQNRWESLYVVDKARLMAKLNFGWSVVEGAHCFRPAPSCDASGFQRVVFDYPHGEDGCSITGGYTYRGKAFKALWGTHVLGDYCSGRVWTIARAQKGQGADGFIAARALDTRLQISSFGEDEDGELWLVDHIGGSIRQIVVKP